MSDDKTKLSVSVLKELTPDKGWKNADDELPEPNVRVECAYIHGSMRPYVEIRDSVMSEQNRFRGCFDWVRVSHWRYYSNVK